MKGCSLGFKDLLQNVPICIYLSVIGVFSVNLYFKPTALYLPLLKCFGDRNDTRVVVDFLSILILLVALVCKVLKLILNSRGLFDFLIKTKIKVKYLVI